MVGIRLPDYLGPDPEPAWYTPEAQEVLRRAHELARKLDITEEALFQRALEALENLPMREVVRLLDPES